MIVDKWPPLNTSSSEQHQCRSHLRIQHAGSRVALFRFSYLRETHWNSNLTIPLKSIMFSIPIFVTIVNNKCFPPGSRAKGSILCLPVPLSGILRCVLPWCRCFLLPVSVKKWPATLRYTIPVRAQKWNRKKRINKFIYSLFLVPVSFLLDIMRYHHNFTISTTQLTTVAGMLRRRDLGWMKATVWSPLVQAAMGTVKQYGWLHAHWGLTVKHHTSTSQVHNIYNTTYNCGCHAA